MPSERNNRNIIFIFPYPLGFAPGQRFRFEQYILSLKKHFNVYRSSFLDVKTNERLYRKGLYFPKFIGVLNGFINRLLLLFEVSKFDLVFIFREATPLGPPIFEWIIAKILRKKIIYDFDDAIWLPNTSEENWIVAKLKWHSKVANICRWSHKISCGNAYLCDYASQFNKNVTLNPTTIDTENWHNPALFSKKNTQTNEKPIIGWTGTHSTLHYLELIVPVLQKLEKQYEFTFLVIANKEPNLPLKSFKFKHWNKKTEIRDLLSFDIGLMPLNDDIWAKGKCGFKALQYMALEIPAVASPIGVNQDIISHGVNGFLCSTYEEWYQAIERLILKPDLRESMGKQGREKVIESYSVVSNRANFLDLFSFHAKSQRPFSQF